MESVSSSPNPPIQNINGLTKTQLQELCEAINRHITDYDYLIKRQISQKDKNYKLIIELGERKLDLISTYKQYKSDLLSLK